MPAVEVDVVLRLEEGQLLFQGADAGLALVQLKLGQPGQDLFLDGAQLLLFFRVVDLQAVPQDNCPLTTYTVFSFSS